MIYRQVFKLLASRFYIINLMKKRWKGYFRLLKKIKSFDMQKIMLDDFCVDVVQKDIRNLHLSVYPPSGMVRISAPLRMDLETIRTFAISKLHWIKKQQNKIRSQEREEPREFINRESHYYMGKRYLLKVMELNSLPKVELQHGIIEMFVS